jgi:hypothetical protein
VNIGSRRRVIAALVGALACGAFALVLRDRAGAAAGDGGAAPAPAPAPHPVAAAVAAGRHERLDTEHGPVHVWVPAGYHADGAAAVVYVHGYYTDVDTAWASHRLPEQFALSGLDALFVACEAPRGNRAPVAWRSLGELLDLVSAETAIARPTGPLIAVAHSGGFRTLLDWIDYPLLDTIVLLDALYDQIDPFREWLLGASGRRLIDVTVDTVRWSEELVRDLGAAGEVPVVVDRIPFDDREWPEAARGARALTVRSQYTHMELVTGGVVLPMVLRLLPVQVLSDAPWAHPPGDLP